MVRTLTVVTVNVATGESPRPHLLFLQARGYHVDAISNGDDALALLRDNAYDLVLLDEQMPGRRGLEVLEILRRGVVRAA